MGRKEEEQNRGVGLNKQDFFFLANIRKYKILFYNNLKTAYFTW